MPKRQRDESPVEDILGSTSEPDSSTFDAPVPIERTVKYVQTVDAPEIRRSKMKCSLPPHQEVLSFDTFEDFEVHYAKAHANRCSECRRNFPTEHFLTLHIGENHDPLRAAKSARGEKTVGYPFSLG